MSKHTPGPWMIRRSTSTDRWWFVETQYVDEGQTDGPEAEINANHLKQKIVAETIQAEANAHLIAAAPELLHACKLLLDYVLEESGPNCRGAQEAITAIAKAEGK